MTDHERDEFDLIRALGEDLNMPRELPDQSGPENVDELMARLRRNHGALPNQNDDSRSDSSKVDSSLARRRVAMRSIRGLMAAAAVVVAVGVVAAEPWNSQSASADEPPVLDFEFAEATAISYSPGEPADSVLQKLSKAAATQPFELVADGAQHVITDNWLTELRTDSETTTGSLIPRQRESWMLPDGSLVWTETDGDALSADGRTKPSRILSGSGGVVQGIPAGSLDSGAGINLPTTPAELRSSLLQYLGCAEAPASNETGRCILQSIMDLSGYAVIPPNVLAAAWQVLAEEPDVTSLGRVTDRLGREGVALSIIPDSSPDFRLVLIIDPRTGMISGTETILIRESADLDLEAPAIYAFTAIVASEFVAADQVPTPEHDAS